MQWRVDVIHRGAVNAPVDSVGDRDAVDHAGRASFHVEAVERGRAGRLVICHRAGPEATRRIAPAIVEPPARSSLGDSGDAPSWTVADHPEAILQRGDEAALRAWRDRSDLKWRLDRLGSACHRVREVDAPAENVDPGDLAGSRVPDRAFPELCAGGDDGLDGRYAICLIHRPSLLTNWGPYRDDFRTRLKHSNVAVQ